MIHIEIPGFGILNLKHLVLDYNGTLAVDGYPMDEVEALLTELTDRLYIHILTADTFGSAGVVLKNFPGYLEILSSKDQHIQKGTYVKKLGSRHVVSIGNGRNDRDMLKLSALGIAVVEQEGSAIDALINADIVASSIIDALKLLLFPKRLIASLRS
jgi:soluble P-type ATPase